MGVPNEETTRESVPLPVPEVRPQVAEEDRNPTGPVPKVQAAPVGHEGESATETRLCHKCKLVKPLSMFSPDVDRGTRLSINYRCKECFCLAMRKHRHRKPLTPWQKIRAEAKAAGGKVCTRCQTIKPLSSFYSDKRLRSGLFSWCRACVSIDAQERHRRQAEERSVAGYPERKNVPCEKICRHCGIIKPITEFSRREQRADGHNSWCRKCDSARVVRWAAAHPEWARERASKKRALKQGSTVGDTSVMRTFIKRVHSALRIRCNWCRKLVPKGRRHVDHIIPLSKGGPHAETNLCCSCSICNMKKGAKDPGDFSRQRELLLLPVREGK